MPSPTSVNQALHQIDRADLDTTAGRDQMRRAIAYLREREAAGQLDEETSQVLDHASRQLRAAAVRQLGAWAGNAVDAVADTWGNYQDWQARLGQREVEYLRWWFGGGERPGGDDDGGQRSGTARRGASLLPGPGDRGEDRYEPDPVDDLASLFGLEGDADPDPYIGVPPDHTYSDQDSRYRYARQEAAGIGPGGRREPHREPLYRQSDVQGPFGWSTARISQLQDRLVDAGLLTGEFRRGWYDAPTGDAYAQALGMANLRALPVTSALDQLAQQHQQQLEEEGAGDPAAVFQPRVPLPPDPAMLRRQARDALVAIGRRHADIDADEIARMVDVMSGAYRQQRQVETEWQRRMFDADQAGETADMGGLQEVDPQSLFDEWFRSDEGFGGEIETREMSAEVGRRTSTFRQGLSQMTQQVRGGGA